ncbi:wound-induced proteinase inhibitor 2-like [Capsicum galapagoense]
MAVPKEVSFLASLLVLGILLLHVDAKACSQRNAKEPICTNCCAGRKGCNYYSADGTFICEGESDPNNPKPCTLNCDPRIFYSKCPRSEGNAENRICTNCCAGRKGCNYYSADGTFICEGESDPNNPKACPRNCDPRIFYSKCPRSEGNAENRICTNCCAGRKGCNYYSADGTFICEGESDPNNPKPCTLNCDPRIFYSKCPRSEASAEQPICTNCCAGLKGCNYYNADGTFICEGESDPNHPKACPKNCDPNIAYSLCLYEK